MTNLEERAREWITNSTGNSYQLIESLTALLTQVQAEARERLAAWMVEHSFATGHGDTFEDLLKELEWQVKELRAQAVAPATKEG